MGGGKKGWKGKEKEIIERRRVGKNLGSADFQTWERVGSVPTFENLHHPGRIMNPPWVMDVPACGS